MLDLGKIGIGPLSSEIIEAVFRYSKIKKMPIMLVVSKNQIDWDGGYVNNWTTGDFAMFIKKMKKQYPGSKVYICRDHCGPGFKNNSIKDVYKTIDTDIKAGFDLIHIDFSKLKNYKKVLQESKKAIEYIFLKTHKVSIEIGTEENKGDILIDLSKVEKEIEFFRSIAPIYSFVVQTGSLVEEINQVGRFNKTFILKVKNILHKNNIKLKEHNGDYLNGHEISIRKNLVDAINIAPQYGVLQTLITIQKCVTYGINYSEFLDDAYRSKKWEKWSSSSSDSSNKFLCSVIAGHYVFSHDSYKKIVNEINKYTSLKESIIKEIVKNISYYSKRF